jgi:hypothetical protein
MIPLSINQAQLKCFLTCEICVICGYELSYAGASVRCED